MKKKNLFFLVIAFIFSFLPFYRILFSKGIIANVDFTQFFLLNSNFLEEYPYVWKEYLLGTFNVLYIVNLSAITLLSSFFKFLHLPVFWINRFWLVFPFFFCGISLYFFIQTFLKKFRFSLLEKALILVFTLSSPLVPHYLSLGWQEAYFLPLGGTFFMVSFLFRFLKKNDFRNLILALVFSLLSVQLMHFFIFANICFLIYLLFFEKKPFQNKLKNALAWFCPLFLINFWWIAPLLGNYFYNPIVNYRYNPIADIEYLKNVVSFRDVLFLGQTKGTGIIQKYQSSSPITIIRTIFPLLFAIGYLQALKKKRVAQKSLFLGIIFILLVFFGAGAHPPFGGIFIWAFKNVPMFYMFRNIGKLGAFISFIYAIFIVYSFKKALSKKGPQKIVTTILLAFFALISSYPLITGNLAGDLQPLNLPDEYLEINSAINNNKQDFKVLNLPMPEWCSKFSWMEDKEVGAQIFNPFYMMLNKPIIFDELKNTGLNPVQKLAVFSICKANQEQTKLLSLLNIGKIIFQKDQLNKPMEFCSNEELLEKTDALFPQEKTGEFVNLYKISDEYFLPHFYIPQNIIYSPNDIEILPEILSMDDYEIRSAIFLNADNADREDADNTDIGADKAGKDADNAGKDADKALNADKADIKNADNADEENADKADEKDADRRARITRIEGADEIFVKGEEKEDIEKILNQVQDDGGGGIVYPYVKHEPGSWQWKAALLKEKYDKWQARKEPEKLLEKHLFYANKRINEIEKWGNLEISSPLAREIRFADRNADNALNADNADRENADNADEERITLMGMWEKDLEEAIGLLEKIEEEEKRTEWAIKIKKTIADNAEKIADNADREDTDNTDIGTDNADGKTLAEQVDRLNQSLDRYIPKLDISKREYEIEIPRKGNYSLFINELTNSRIEELKNWELEIDGEKIADNALNADNADIKNADNADREDADNADRGADKADRNANNTDGGWRECGEINLEEGKHVLTLGFGEIPNLINADIVADNADRKNTDNADRKTDNADGGVAIAEWRNNQWYQVKGKLIEKTKIGQEKIIIEQKDKEEEEKKEEAEWKEIKMYQPNENEFTFYFKSGDSSELGRLVLENITLKDFENLSVRPVWESEIVLRSKNADIKNADNADRKDTDKADEESADEKTRIPKITFVKINPTKYRIKVEGAKEPYTLVFSESFHEGWRLYADNADKENTDKADEEDADNTDYGEIVASYFDGQIKEGTHRNTFLEPATFETWGKKPIAQDSHLMVNGYANSWRIYPDDVGGEENYELIVEFWPQRLFYIGLFISGLTLVGCLGYLGYEIIKKRN